MPLAKRHRDRLRPVPRIELRQQRIDMTLHGASVMKRDVPISWLLLPAAIRRRTSCSRGVSSAVRADLCDADGGRELLVVVLGVADEREADLLGVGGAGGLTSLLTGLGEDREQDHG
jgi:hypothetical protein